MKNIRIDCQIDAGEFERLLYTLFLEEPFKNQRIHMTEETDGYTISDCFSQHFGTIIGEIMKFITCHENNPPKVLKDDSFILRLE